MAKKVKYEMYINTANMLGNLIPLSKKVFNETLKNYKLQAEEDNKYDLEKFREEFPDKDERFVDFRISMDVDTTEHEKYIETLYAFHDAGSAICLRKRECKEGYYWK